MSHATQLEGELEKLKGKIEKNPDEDSMVELAHKIRADHDTVQEALRYAEIPEKDKKKLMRLYRSRLDG